MRHLSDARQKYIQEQLQLHGSVQVSSLATELRVSEVSVRRYLAQMEEVGLLVRFYGGALLPQAVVPDLSFRERVTTHRDEKRRVGAAAADLVRDGDTVALGAGTTVATVAAALVGKRNLSLVTNAINVAWEFAHRPDVRVVMTGGVLRASTYALIGRAAEQTLRDLFTDIAFVGVNGVSPTQGFTTPNPEEAMVNHALLTRSARSVVVVDHSKWGRVALQRIAQVSEVSTVITDDQTPPEQVEAMRRQGVEVIVA